MEKVLVTGVSGFLGHHCAVELLKSGYYVKGSIRDLNKKSEFILYPKMTLAIKLDLHELEGEGLRVEQVVEITETGARPLNKLAMKVKDDWAIL